MSVFHGATNTTINNGIFNAVSTTVANVGAQTDIVGLLHSQSATAGLLDAKERFDAPKCEEGTRTSMILGMKKFVQDGDANSSPALYWLHGPAGVGKSALAQSLSLELKSEGDHAASFFFSRTSPGRNNGDQLIVTLAYQLATNFPALQPFMSKVVKKNPAILTASNAMQMQTLIIDPINKWQKKYYWSAQRWAHKIFHSKKKPHPRLILVDGLDECSNPNVQKALIICIGSAVRQLSIPLRFVIASRPESHILATFELDPIFQFLDGVTFTRMNLGDDEDADEHITRFLLKEFAEIRRVHPIRGFLPVQWPLPDQIECLVSKSSKGFIYPATVIRYIKMPNNRPDECLERILGLSAIPTSDKPYEQLDGLYRHIFESVPDINKTSVHEICHFLALPSTWDGVKSPGIIERHFGYKPGHVQHVLHDLLCLVAFTDDECIKVLHASLPDFLVDQSRSGPLYIDINDAFSTIAAGCLLDVIRTNAPPVSSPPDRDKFVAPLKYLMQPKLSNTVIHHRLMEMDLVSWYQRLCHEKLEVPDAQSPHARSWSHYTASDRIKIRYLADMEYPADVFGEYYRFQRPSETIPLALSFMVSYLRVVVMKDGTQQYISDQIAGIKAYVLRMCPFLSSVHAVDELMQAMTPAFREWTNTLFHKHINHIFAFEVAASQYQIRQDIFELHFLMIVPFYSASKDLARQLIRTKVEKEAMKPINWADFVGGRAETEWLPA